MSEFTCSTESLFAAAIETASTEAARDGAIAAHDRHLDRCQTMTCSELRAERDEHLAEVAAERQMDEVMGGFTRGSWDAYVEDNRERDMAWAFGSSYRA